MRSDLASGRASRGPLPPGRSTVVRSAVTRFVVWSVAVLLVVASGTLLLSKPLAESLSLHEADVRSVAFANSVVAPLVDEGVRAGRPEAMAPLERLMRARMADGSIAHMKIWTADGLVLWTDAAGEGQREREQGEGEQQERDEAQRGELPADVGDVVLDALGGPVGLEDEGMAVGGAVADVDLDELLMGLLGGVLGLVEV